MRSLVPYRFNINLIDFNHMTQALKYIWYLPYMIPRFSTPQKQNLHTKLYSIETHFLKEYIKQTAL